MNEETAIEIAKRNYDIARGMAEHVREVTGRMSLNVWPNPHSLASAAADVAAIAADAALVQAIVASLPARDEVTEWKALIYTEPDGDGTPDLIVWADDRQFRFGMYMCAQLPEYFRTLPSLEIRSPAIKVSQAMVAPTLESKIVNALGEFYDEQADDVVANVAEVCRRLRDSIHNQKLLNKEYQRGLVDGQRNPWRPMTEGASGPVVVVFRDRLGIREATICHQTSVPGTPICWAPKPPA